MFRKVSKHKCTDFLPLPILPFVLIGKLGLFVFLIALGAFFRPTGMTSGVPFNAANRPAKLINIFFLAALCADFSSHGFTPVATL